MHAEHGPAAEVLRPPLAGQPVECRSIETIAAALDRARVRYLVVGGIAVVAHGHVRFTAGLDLVFESPRDPSGGPDG